MKTPESSQPFKNPGDPRTLKNVRSTPELAVKNWLTGLDIPLLIYDSAGTIILLNAAFTRLTGYSASELVGRTPPYAFQIESRAKPPPLISGLYAGRRTKFGSLNRGTRLQAVQTRDALRLWVLTRKTTLQFSPLLSGFLEIWEDVTALIDKQNELNQTLKNSEYKYRKLFNAVPIPLAVNSLPELTFVDINRPFLQASGFKRREIIGQNPESLDWDTPKQVKEIRDIIRQGRQVTRREIKLLTRDGQAQTAILYARAVELEGRRYSISASIDISERKHMEEALKQSERFNSRLMRYSSNPLIVLNPDGSIRYVNPALEKMTGYTAAELIGRKQPYPWWPPESVRQYRRENRELSLQGARVNDRQCINKAGRPFWISYTVFPIKEKNRVIYFLSNWTDITERKLAELALRESEAFNTVLLEKAPNPIMVINPDSSIRYVNPALENLTGFSRGELIGRRSPYPWWPPENAAAYLKDQHSNKRRFNARAQRELQDRRGKRFWVEFTSTKVKEKNRIIFFIINWLDITDRKMAEDELREKEAYISSVLQDAPDPLSVTDGEGRLIFVNQALLRKTGFTREELIGSGQPYPWWRPQDLDLFKCRETDYIDRDTNTLECIYRHKDGSEFWVTLHIRKVVVGGKFIHYLTNWFDITERKAAEDELREKEAFNQSLINDGPNPILVVNADHSIRLINQAFEKLTGYASAELVGRGLPLPWWPPEHAAQYTRDWIKASASQYYTYTRDGLARDGSPFTIFVTVRWIKEEGENKYAIVNCVDITDQVKATNALRESEAFNSSLLNDSPVPILVTNPDMSIRYVNPAMEALTGYTSVEMVGLKAPFPWWPSDKKAAYLEDDSKHYQQEFHSYVRQGVSKSGREFWIAVSARRVFENGGLKYNIANCIDITEARQAEESLKASEAFNQSLMQNAPNPILVVNPDSSIRFVNPALEKLTGYTLAEVKDIFPPYPWWLPENDPRYPFKQEPIMHDQELNNEERILKKKNGDIFWISLSLRKVMEKETLLYYLGNWTDITARKNAETRLQEELLRRRILIDQSRDGIVVLDDEGAVFEANQRFMEMLGYTPQEIKQLHVSDWEDMLPYDDLMHMIHTVDEKGDHLETRHRRKDGSCYDVDISTNAAYFGGQKLIFCVCRDITERKITELALQAELVRRRILIDQSRDGIVVMDREGGIYEANQRFAEMLGYTHAEIMQLHVWDWDDSIGRDRLVDMITSVDEKGDHFETRHRRKDGSLYDVEISSNGADFEGQKLIFCVCRDITERKQAESALRESEAFNSSLLNNAPNPIIVSHLNSAIRYVNPAFEKLTGFSSAEIFGARVPYPWWPSDKQAQYLAEDSIGIHKDSNILERVLINKNGQTFWAIESIHKVKEENQTVKYYISNWQDITERKKIEEAIRESEAFNASLLNDAPNPVIVYNLDSSVRFINPAMEKLTGYSSAEIIGGKPPYPWWPPELVTQFTLEKQAHVNFETDNMERQAVKKNGEIFWISISMRRVREQGRDKYFLSNWLDITERKLMEERIIDLYQKEKSHREELQEEARARGLFINVLAHELRTPVTPILASTGMLSDLYASQPEDIKKRLVTNIYNGTRTLSRRLEELLDLARYSRGTFKLAKQPVDLGAFFRESLALFTPTIEERRQQLFVEIQENLPVVNIDASRLEQVMSNLLSNSSKFTPEQGRIYVKVTYLGQTLRVEVKDEGIGITPEDQKRLFQPYHRVEQDRQQFTGLGLGLAVSKQIIEAHGGKIWVESVIDKGSTFIFTIPLFSMSSLK